MKMETEESMIYLRGPGGGVDDDDDQSEEEGRDEDAEEESREGDAFKSYIARHQKKTESRIAKTAAEGGDPLSKRNS